jgi:hypothetical protein
VSTQVKKGFSYFIVPLSSGCKYKQYLFSLKSFPPPGEELSRQMWLKIYCDDIFVVRQKDFDRNIYDTAILLSILSGTVIEAVQGKVELYYVKGGCAGMSYGAKNIVDRPVQLNINFEDHASDMISHKGTLKTSELLDPGEFKILHHICPKGGDSTLNFDWECSAVAAVEKDRAPARTPNLSTKNAKSQESSAAANSGKGDGKPEGGAVGADCASCKCVIC